MIAQQIDRRFVLTYLSDTNSDEHGRWSSISFPRCTKFNILTKIEDSLVLPFQVYQHSYQNIACQFTVYPGSEPHLIPPSDLLLTLPTELMRQLVNGRALIY